MDMYNLSKIPVRQQKWTGWPSPPQTCDWVLRQQRIGELSQFDLNLPPAPFTEQVARVLHNHYCAILSDVNSIRNFYEYIIRLLISFDL